MALPMCDQFPTRPALALVPDSSTERPRPLAPRRLPASVYWFRRALAAAVLLLVLWASSLLASELQWTLNPENPAGATPPAPAYVMVGDTAFPVSADSR